MESSIRERIIEHVAWQFLNNGIKNITMDEIAEQLGMSKRTIYEHFQDKKELVTESMLFFKTKNDDERREIFRSAENPFAGLLRLYRARKEGMFKVSQKFVDDIKKYFPEVNKQHEEAMQKMKKSLADIFTKAADEGYVLPTLNPAILGHLFTEEMTTVFEKRFSHQDPFQFEETYETMCLTFFRGIATEKGREMVEKYL